MERLRKAIKLIAFVFAIVAVVDQLRRRPEERTWEGTVGGIVPYDFRMPTVERAKARWWNPDDRRIFVPQVFGVGWTVNAGRVARLAGVV